MCCYNAETHIKKAIDSILNQSFNDFEFIIWDDGSTDKTKEIIASYSDGRIRYFYHENTGLGEALRLACEKTTAQIIARMDADDYSLPDRFEKEYAFLAKHEDVALVSSAVNYIDDNDNMISCSFPYTNYDVIKKIMLSGSSVIVHPASMFKKAIYIQTGGYHPLKKAQDSLLFSRMMQFGKLAILQEPLLNYRISANSISSQTQHNAYDDLVWRLRKKMINDVEVSYTDVRIYNELVDCAKRYNKSKAKNITSKRLKLSLEMRIYNFLKRIIGESISRKLIIMLKNGVKSAQLKIKGYA